jgi:hypothetical protein
MPGFEYTSTGFDGGLGSFSGGVVYDPPITVVPTFDPENNSFGSSPIFQSGDNTREWMKAQQNFAETGLDLTKIADDLGIIPFIPIDGLSELAIVAQLRRAALNQSSRFSSDARLIVNGQLEYLGTINNNPDANTFGGTYIFPKGEANVITPVTNTNVNSRLGVTTNPDKESTNTSSSKWIIIPIAILLFIFLMFKSKKR